MLTGIKNPVETYDDRKKTAGESDTIKEHVVVVSFGQEAYPAQNKGI